MEGQAVYVRAQAVLRHIGNGIDHQRGFARMLLGKRLLHAHVIGLHLKQGAQLFHQVHGLLGRIRVQVHARHAAGAGDDHAVAQRRQLRFHPFMDIILPCELHQHFRAVAIG